MAIPTAEDVAGWTPAERAEMARLLDAKIERQHFQTRLSRRRTLVIALIGRSGALLLPWVGYLAISLPDAARPEAWKAAWVGFDLALAAVLLGTAWLGWHRRVLTMIGLTVAASLLLTDAWFDLTLSFRTDEWSSSVVSAFVEVPFALLLIFSAQSVLRRQLAIVAVLRGQDKPSSLLEATVVGAES